MENQVSPAAFAAVAVILLAPVLVSLLFRSQKATRDVRDDFLTNRGRNGITATLSGAVAGNIGIGSFLALFLFAQQAPVIAFSVVGAYTLGLVLCALLAPVIRQRAKLVGAVGLIDLVARTHGSERLAPIWLSMAVVFVLRSAVQLGALGFIAAPVFAASPTMAIIVCAALIGCYLLIGGYLAAIQTDIVQAFAIVVCAAVCGLGVSRLEGTPVPFVSFGEYQPAILVGIWLFIPWSAVLAVDNWQRITIAMSTRTASLSYLLAAVICFALLFLMAYAGYRAPQGSDMYTTFALLAPPGMAWIATIMFVACIMSSIDTFIMPLVSAADESISMARIRLVIVALIGMTALTAIVFSDTLDTIITAFNSLAVFLPVAFGALFLERPSAKAAVGSVYAGLLSAIALSFVSQSVASLSGFILAVCAYAILHACERRRQAA